MIQICQFAFQSWFTFSDEEANFEQEIEKHMVVDFSLLELDLKTDGHVFGALVFYLLQINQISSSLQKLKIILLRSVVINFLL